MVVLVGETLIVAPVPSNVPPQEPEYHFHDAPVPKDPPTFDKVIAPPQDGLGLAVAEVGAMDTGVYVNVMTARWIQ